MITLTEMTAAKNSAGAACVSITKFGVPGAGEPSEKLQNSKFSADFARLLSISEVLPADVSLSAELAPDEMPVPMSMLAPAIGSGKPLPLAGMPLPDGGNSSPATGFAEGSQTGPGTRHEAGYSSPELAITKADSAANPPLSDGLKAIFQLLHLGRGGGQALEAEPAINQTEPKQPIAAAKIPVFGIATKPELQLSRGADHGFSQDVSPLAQSAAPAVPSGAAEFTVRQFQPIAASDNTSLSLQLSAQGQASPATMPAAGATGPAMTPYDFEGMVGRLIDARQAATPGAGRGGRTQLAVQHEDFGNVTIRLESAAAGMKFALSSVDPDFTPAVHSALIDRTIIERTIIERPAADRPATSDLPAGTGQQDAGRGGGGGDHSSGAANNNRRDHQRDAQPGTHPNDRSQSEDASRATRLRAGHESGVYA